MQHPDVLDAAVVGVTDDVVGDLPRAFVVPRSPDVNPHDILHFVHGLSRLDSLLQYRFSLVCSNSL